jgi:phage tail sheath protein FI
MPVPLSYPGVYIEEVSSGVRTITGVATSITTFFGRTNKGPLNRAVRCLSHADFVRSFGGAPTGSELALSVKQFYDNGGSDCYVVRLARAGTARRAAVTLGNHATPSVAVLTVTAKVEGLWGNGIRLEVDYNTPSPGETFNLKVFWEEGGRVVKTEHFANLSMDIASSRYCPSFVTQSSDLVDVTLGTGLGDPTAVGSFYNTLANSFAGFSENRRPLGTAAAAVQATLQALITPGSGPASHSFDISVNSSAYVTVNLSNWTVPATIAPIASELGGRINQALAALVPAPKVAVTVSPSTEADGEHFLRITSDDVANVKTSVRVRRAAANDISGALMLGTDSGGVELARRGNFRPAPTGTIFRYDQGLGDLTRLNAMAGLDQPGLTSVSIDGTAVPLSLQTTGAGDAWFRNAAGASALTGDRDGVREKLRILAQAISGTAGLRYKAEVHGYQLVLLAKEGTVNQTPAVALTPATAPFAVQTNVRQYALGDANGTSSPFVNAGTVVIGNDGNPPLFADFVGDPVQQTGFHALDTVDLVNLIVIPRDDAIPAADRFATWGPASIYCRSRRAFLLIEVPDDWTVNGRAAVVQNTVLVNNLRATVVKDHSAVFYPKVRVNDAGTIRALGSSGAIAGLMARTDAARGVWKAPAGTEADLRGLAGLEVTLTDLENGVLNKLGVNCARSFISGYVNWGARTMDGADDLGSEWKYIPIRRLALFLEESLYRGTQWVVFEPNDEPLWAKVRLNIGAFMNGLFRQGAFQGSTPSQAYYVKCDAETTTQADRNLGIVNIEVGFAPLKPAEFVVIKIQQIAGDLT